MIKLFSLKKEGEKGNNNNNNNNNSEKQSSSSSNTKQNSSPGHLRLQKDLSELELPTTMKMMFPDKNNILSFELSILPDENYYKGGCFKFSFLFKPSYPHDPPKVRCLHAIYPNIDIEGNVCLNILREDWKPVLSVQSIAVGLQFLFLEPNYDDPLNKGNDNNNLLLEAALALKSNKDAFRRNVQISMAGGIISGQKYDKVL
jgi:ubiquitin-conjugating enzyme E2 M